MMGLFSNPRNEIWVFLQRTERNTRNEVPYVDSNLKLYPYTIYSFLNIVILLFIFVWAVLYNTGCN